MVEWHQLGLGGVMAALFFWLMRATYGTFKEHLEVERSERAKLVERFTAVVDNHIGENTRALCEVHDALRKLCAEQRRYHPERNGVE
jgi:hypothetical protein